jgi:FlaA1/EpsC-like NDP-sugar epimerase
MGSRGSVIPYFMSMKDKGTITITDERMTRFMISLDQGVDLVWHAFEDMVGGEIYIRKIPSMKITDIANVIAPDAKHEIIGIRPGEKLHEQMIGIEDAPYTYEYNNHFKILPQINNWDKDIERFKNGIKVKKNFIYNSENNSKWMTKSDLQAWININQKFLGKI